jgi:hypothetical protein
VLNNVIIIPRHRVSTNPHRATQLDATCSAIPYLLGEKYLTPFFSGIPDENPTDLKTRKDAILRGLRATIDETGDSESTPMPNLYESFEVKVSALGGYGLFATKNIQKNTRIPYLGE